MFGAGAGLVLGFSKGALGEAISPSGSFGMMLVPTGWFKVGLFCGVLMGLLGGVVGLITGALGSGPFQGAAAGFLLWLFQRRRTLYSDIRGFPRTVKRYLRRRT